MRMYADGKEEGGDTGGRERRRREREIERDRERRLWEGGLGEGGQRRRGIGEVRWEGSQQHNKPKRIPSRCPRMRVSRGVGEERERLACDLRARRAV